VSLGYLQLKIVLRPIILKDERRKNIIWYLQEKIMCGSMCIILDATLTLLLRKIFHVFYSTHKPYKLLISMYRTYKILMIFLNVYFWNDIGGEKSNFMRNLYQFVSLKGIFLFPIRDSFSPPSFRNFVFVFEYELQTVFSEILSNLN
jgi:hypothetical protein